MWVSPWPWTCLPAYFVDLDKGLRPVLPGGSVVHAVGKWISSAVVTALSVLVMIVVRGVCVRITGVKSSVYWSRCMYSTEASFCLLSCSWSSQRLSRGKDVFQFVLCVLYHCILGLVIQFLFGFIAQSCTAINDVTSCLSPLYSMHCLCLCSVCHHDRGMSWLLRHKSIFSTRVVLVGLFCNQRNIIPIGTKEEMPANLLISSTQSIQWRPERSAYSFR